MNSFFTLLLELLGFSKQIAENQGAKIPMREPKIRANAEQDAGEIKENSHKDDWIPKVKFYNRCLSLRWQRHATNQVSRLIDAGCTITAVGLELDAHHGYWLYIYYTEGNCQTYYRIPVNQKKAKLFF